MKTLGNQAIRSGSLVATNHVIGAFITVVSALLYSKVLGPQVFAIYALCISLSGILRGISRLGVNAYLLTRKEDPPAEEYHVALTTMLIFSIVVACATITVLPWLGHFSRISHLFWPGVATVTLLPLNVFPLPALTMLERQLKFRPVVLIELMGQVVGQFFGIWLAFCGWGIWGPIAGWGVRAILQGVAPWVVVGMMPRIRWNIKNAKKMLKFGVGYVITANFAQSRTLVLLAIVGRLVGQEAVGHMGLALRAVGLAAPFRAAVSRVLTPVIAPIAHLPATLRERINVAVETELLLSIPVIVFAVAIYPFSIRFILGPSWQSTATLFPWLAAGSILFSAHAASLSALHVRGFFLESIVSTLASFSTLALALTVLSEYWGIEGCAAATVVAWPASWTIEWFSKRRLGNHWSKNGVVWAIGGASACLAWSLWPWALFLPTIICVATHDAIKFRAKALYAALFLES